MLPHASVVAYVVSTSVPGSSVRHYRFSAVRLKKDNRNLTPSRDDWLTQLFNEFQKKRSNPFGCRKNIHLLLTRTKFCQRPRSPHGPIFFKTISPIPFPLSRDFRYYTLSLGSALRSEKSAGDPSALSVYIFPMAPERGILRSATVDTGSLYRTTLNQAFPSPQ
ncbi:hypothetical protein TRVL_05798 [Trypanosoma vivax]|nr:hypothetical protein TRVL_05798 [Trypanosoma vivax]